MTKTINIGKDFTDTPIGRYSADSDFSGERFREEFLVPALNEASSVRVIIDEVEGFGSSFLEEAFGGLVRKGHFNARELTDRLDIVVTDDDFLMYKSLIREYIAEASQSVA